MAEVIVTPQAGRDVEEAIAQLGLPGNTWARSYFDEEAKLTPSELKAREDRRAETNAREIIRKEPW